MKAWIMKQKKTIKKWQRRYKGLKLLQKFFKFLITVANIGISVWKFYDDFIKERLEEHNA